MNPVDVPTVLLDAWGGEALRGSEGEPGLGEKIDSDLSLIQFLVQLLLCPDIFVIIVIVISRCTSNLPLAVPLNV